MGWGDHAKKAGSEQTGRFQLKARFATSILSLCFGALDAKEKDLSEDDEDEKQSRGLSWSARGLLSGSLNEHPSPPGRQKMGGWRLWVVAALLFLPLLALFGSIHCCG